MLKSILSLAMAAGLAIAAVSIPLSASADDLETIKSAGEFKFANSGAYPPFMADGAVVEEGAPDQIFSAPTQERTRTFLRKYLNA